MAIGLGVAEAGGRRVAAGAGVVVVQAGDGVEPEQAAEVGQLRVDAAAQAALEGGLDAAGEAGLAQRGDQARVEGGIGRCAGRSLSAGGGLRSQAERQS